MTAIAECLNEATADTAGVAVTRLAKALVAYEELWRRHRGVSIMLTQRGREHNYTRCFNAPLFDRRTV